MSKMSILRVWARLVFLNMILVEKEREIKDII